MKRLWEFLRRHTRRSPSLLARVAAAAAAGATIIVVTVGAFVWSGIEREAYNQLDRELDVIATVGANLAHRLPLRGHPHLYSGVPP